MQKQIIIEHFLRSEKSYLYKLSCYEKIILIMLASYMGNKNTCWPSFESLIITCSISKRTLIRNIQSLEKKKMITVKRKKNQNNVYKFSSLILSLGIEACKNVGVTQALTGVSQTPTQVSHRHPNNIINNINNNRVAQLKDYEGPVQSASKASSLLENFMNK